MLGGPLILGHTLENFFFRKIFKKSSSEKSQKISFFWIFQKNDIFCDFSDDDFLKFFLKIIFQKLHQFFLVSASFLARKKIKNENC